MVEERTLGAPEPKEKTGTFGTSKKLGVEHGPNGPSQRTSSSKFLIRCE
jgi:hypothetical protein